MADTADELKQYECMTKVKHKSITVQGRKVHYFEETYEDCTEEEAIDNLKEAMNCDGIDSYDNEVAIDDHWVN